MSGESLPNAFALPAFCCSKITKISNTPAKDARMSTNIRIFGMYQFVNLSKNVCKSHAILAATAEINNIVIPNCRAITKVTTTKLPHANAANPDLNLTAGLDAGPETPSKPIPAAKEDARYYFFAMVADTPRWVEFEFGEGDGLKGKFTSMDLEVKLECSEHSSAFQVELLENKSSTGPNLIVLGY